MIQRFVTLCALALILLAAPAAADSPTLIVSEFTNNFRKNLLFRVEAQSASAPITRVELLVQIEGAPSRSRLAAAFVPGAQVRAAYEWNLARDYLPPGARGQFWWEIQDRAGNQVHSPPQTFRVEDQTRAWKRVANDKLAVHWYAGSDRIITFDPRAAFFSFGASVGFGCVALIASALAWLMRRRRAWLIVCSVVALSAGGSAYRFADELPRAARPANFGQALLEHGLYSLEFLERDTGIAIERQIQLYVYGDRDDFFAALEPGAKEWTGGRAFPSSNVILIDIAPDSLEWGKRAVAHEITHLVIHQKIRSPLGELSLPPLIDEGLAVYYESPGAPEPQFAASLQRAIRDDTLISLRALTRAFSADPQIANLSYAQSYSVVDFILRRYGRDKMTQLLQAFKQGGFYDDILIQVLGADLDDLEAAWRKEIGAKPRALPTRARETPTPFPTFSLSTDATPTRGR
ncbi:MAG: hypothetical protein FJ009_20435 [Chloroflexi bacterium]|nr:hypothetical protein [Chloroflexota bacterium]